MLKKEQGETMNLIICIDTNNGMMFNNRRQSRDRVLIEHILDLIGNKKLWITNFSRELFENSNNMNFNIDDNFIEKIGKDEYCFVENIPPNILIDKVEKIILYNWNREYPADRYFDIEIDKWIKETEVKIKGSSHEEIIEQIYIRRR